MKNLSAILNVILLIAVIVLFYLHFSSHKGAIGTTTDNDSTGATSVTLTSKVKDGRIYFINIDSLNKNYELMKDLMQQLNAKETSLQTDYQRAGMQYEKEGMDYQKRLNDNTITIEEARQIEARLKSQEQYIINLEEAMKKLRKEAEGHQISLQNEIDTFMEQYGKEKNIDYVLGYSNVIRTLFYANDSLDITNEVLAGLNARYKEKKKDTAAPKK